MPRRTLCSSLAIVVLASIATVPIAPTLRAQQLSGSSESSGGSSASAQRSSQTMPRVPLRRGQGFQTGIDVVSLAVTVTDPAHKIVGNLQRGDFAVYEDGVIQDLAYFETGDVPLDLALLIDTSASMEGKLGFVRKAATGFTATLRPGDRASVISFNNRVNVMQPFTEDVAAITRAIGRIGANGGTALYNALYITLKEYARDLRKDDVVRRRAIVLLTDGEDTASLMSYDELLREAKREAITVYTIGLRGDVMTPVAREKHHFSQTDFLLKSLASETGALAFFPVREGELSVAYQAIGKELAEQYALGYVSKNPVRNGAYRRVSVQIVNRPDCRPRTRSGYLADALRMASMGTPEN
jgi:Ca-activated chloride channel family protein